MYTDNLNDINAFFDDNTILIQRTLRSGQSLSYDGNIVIVGDVNPGAEVIAGGSVIVIGALRGMVHAGASGDVNAVVIAFKLIPTQLCIVDHITRAPDNVEISNDMVPEIASLKNGMVTIEKWKAKG